MRHWMRMQVDSSTHGGQGLLSLPTLPTSGLALDVHRLATLHTARALCRFCRDAGSS